MTAVEPNHDREKAVIYSKNEIYIIVPKALVGDRKSTTGVGRAASDGSTCQTVVAPGNRAIFQHVNHRLDPAALVALLVCVAVGPHGKAIHAYAVNANTIIAPAIDSHAAGRVGLANYADAARGAVVALHAAK